MNEWQYCKCLNLLSFPFLKPSLEEICFQEGRRVIDIHTKYEEQQLLIASGAWTTSSSSSVPNGQGTDGRATTTLAHHNQLLASGSVGGGGSGSGGGGGGGGYQNPVFNLESGGEGVQHEGFWQGGDDVAGQRYEYLQIQQSQYWRRLTVEQQQR